MWLLLWLLAEVWWVAPPAIGLRHAMVDWGGRAPRQAVLLLILVAGRGSGCVCCSIFVLLLMPLLLVLLLLPLLELLQLLPVLLGNSP